MYCRSLLHIRACLDYWNLANCFVSHQQPYNSLLSTKRRNSFPCLLYLLLGAAHSVLVSETLDLKLKAVVSVVEPVNGQRCFCSLQRLCRMSGLGTRYSGILVLSGLLLLLTILQLDFWIWAGYVALQTGHYPVVLTISFIAAMCNFHSPAYQ